MLPCDHITAWPDTIQRYRDIAPGSLAETLGLLEADEALRASLGPDLLSGYLRLRASEINAVKGESDEAICARYAAAY